ncbi:cold shock and DUF1294 domain-containing protein [Nocardioides sp.]|uniref:cold shock and DUF1294 domain-containing protein n=1 Tax=Nocardioides sp. TaxID=35761 RepID=UPI0027333A4C|nr:cold shock and DUF1294 domain-containing protein [Nocardioides sp.]MDP3894194.1 cold shock and DUF1294 domain-containing protein [Nocardioides sp.]
MSSDRSFGREHGVVASWNDKRGFGFITPVAGGSRVFVHVSSLPRDRRPVTGSEVSFVQGRDERGRPRALQVHYVSAERVSRPGTRGVPLALATASLFFAVLVGLVVLGELHALLVVAYGVLSAVTFLMYAGDKSAAVEGGWRTPESTLHLLALVGGWPGALIARRVFRHKTIKQPFRTIFWGTVLVNCAALAWLVYEAPLTLP